MVFGLWSEWSAALCIQKQWRMLGSLRMSRVQAQLRSLCTCVVCMHENATRNTRCACGASTCRSCTVAMENPESCPICRQPRTLAPSDGAMLRLFRISKLKLDCPHCGKGVDAHEHGEHVSWCVKREHACPMRGCPFQGACVDMFAHLQSAHDAPLLRRDVDGSYSTTVLFTPAVSGVVFCLDNRCIVSVQTAKSNMMALFENFASPMWLNVTTVFPRPNFPKLRYVVQQYDHEGEDVVDEHRLGRHAEMSFAMVPRSRGMPAMPHGASTPGREAAARRALADRAGLRLATAPSAPPVPVALISLHVS